MRTQVTKTMSTIQVHIYKKKETVDTIENKRKTLLDLLISQILFLFNYKYINICLFLSF